MGSSSCHPLVVSTAILSIFEKMKHMDKLNLFVFFSLLLVFSPFFFLSFFLFFCFFFSFSLPSGANYHINFTIIFGAVSLRDFLSFLFFSLSFFFFLSPFLVESGANYHIDSFNNFWGSHPARFLAFSFSFSFLFSLFSFLFSLFSFFSLPSGANYHINFTIIFGAVTLRDF